MGLGLGLGGLQTWAWVGGMQTWARGNCRPGPAGPFLDPGLALPSHTPLPGRLPLGGGDKLLGTGVYFKAMFWGPGSSALCVNVQSQWQSLSGLFLTRAAS